MTGTIETAPTIRRADSPLTAIVGDELLMMSVEHGAYFNLNSVGARIWDLLAEPTTLDGLVEALTCEYDMDPTIVRSEVERFLEDLRVRNLLATDDPAQA